MAKHGHEVEIHIINKSWIKTFKLFSWIGFAIGYLRVYVAVENQKPKLKAFSPIFRIGRPV